MTPTCVRFSETDNEAVKWGREVAVTYQDRDLQLGTGILGLERGPCWKSWSCIEVDNFKTADRLVYDSPAP